MMFCPECGETANETAKYCRNCGTKLFITPRTESTPEARSEPSDIHNHITPHVESETSTASAFSQEAGVKPSQPSTADETAESSQGTVTGYCRRCAERRFGTHCGLCGDELIPPVTDWTEAPEQHPPSPATHEVAGGKSLARFAFGCVGVPVIAVILLIGGCVAYFAVQPKDVGYDDVLTTTNASTFADHNANWNNDDANNVAYVQRAMQHLGDKAFGRKFGALMDWEKNYEKAQADKQHAERQAAYDKLHPTPKPLSSAQQAAKNYADNAGLRNEDQTYWNKMVLEMAYVAVASDLAAIAVDQNDAVDASRALTEGEDHASDVQASIYQDVPGNYGDVRDSLFNAAADEKKGLGELKDYLDNEKPSTGAAAKEDGEKAVGDLNDARAAASDAYKAIGGKPSDLEDFDTARSFWKAKLSASGASP